MDNYNPYYTYGGVFVPHCLLSASKISHGAKLLYALIASRADLRGSSLLNLLLLGAEMGESEAGVLDLLGELENTLMIKLQHDPSGTEFLYCYFSHKTWQRGPQPDDYEFDRKAQAAETVPRLLRSTESVEERGKHGLTGIGAGAIQQMKNTKLGEACENNGFKSRFSKQVCIEYAKACQERGQNIRNPYALGTGLWKSGESDEEIMLWLRMKESDEGAA